MLKAIKVRIYPTDDQVGHINRQLGCCRLVYNNCLAYRRDSYKESNISVSQTDTIKRIVELKKEKEWLKEVHSKVLQQSVIDLNRAFESFFKG